VDLLLKKIVSLSEKGVEDFQAMQLERKKVKAILHDSRLQMNELQKLCDMVDKAETDLKSFEGNAEKFKDYVKEKKVKKTVLVDHPQHSTICSSCTHVCHQNCGLNEIKTMGSHEFKGCYAFSGANNCCQCPEKCSYTVHYHARKTISTETVTMNEILQDIKAKYDEAIHRKGDTKTQMLTLASSKAVVEEAMQDMSKRILDSCASIQNLCKNFNLVEELDITVQQLEIEAGLLTSFAAKEQAKEFIRSIKNLIDKLSKETDERKKIGIKGGVFQYSSDREQIQIRNMEAERKRLEEEERKSTKKNFGYSTR